MSLTVKVTGNVTLDVNPLDILMDARKILFPDLENYDRIDYDTRIIFKKVSIGRDYEYRPTHKKVTVEELELYKAYTLVFNTLLAKNNKGGNL